MLDRAFRSLPVDMIFADCHPQNIASMRILQSLGFGPAGLRTSFSLALGRKTEVMRFELTHETYAAREATRKSPDRLERLP